MSEEGVTRTAALRVMVEVLEERQRQIDHYGHDPARDAARPVSEWAWLLGRRASDLAAPPYSPVDRRRLMIEIAAVAVAAIEAYDAPTPDF